MFDFFIPIEMYDRVMDSDKIKNKCWGYFWRVAIIYAVLFGTILLMVTLLSGGSMWRNVTPVAVTGTVLMGLILCVVFPLVSFRLVSRKSQSEKR